MTTSATGAPHPGIVAGAVLRAARLSARLSAVQLATEADTDEVTVRAWEDGSKSLAFAPYSQVEQLKTALLAAGSDPRLVADLDAAAWCDLVVGALANSSDVTCLLADSVACEDGFRELLAWSLTGSVPSRYGLYAVARPLVTAADATLAAGVVQLVDLIRRLGRSAAAR